MMYAMNKLPSERWLMPDGIDLSAAVKVFNLKDRAKLEEVLR